MSSVSKLSAKISIEERETSDYCDYLPFIVPNRSLNYVSCQLSHQQNPLFPLYCYIRGYIRLLLTAIIMWSCLENLQLRLIDMYALSL